MTKQELMQKTDFAVEEIRTALQTVFDALNQGQQKKILKDPAVAALFERYGVIT
jgi:hypothetical protein